MIISHLARMRELLPYSKTLLCTAASLSPRANARVASAKIDKTTRIIPFVFI